MAARMVLTVRGPGVHRRTAEEPVEARAYAHAQGGRTTYDVGDDADDHDADDRPGETRTTMARTRFAVCADVDDFALEHPSDAGYAHADFLSARSLRVQLSVDHRLLDGLTNVLLKRSPLKWSPFR